MLYLAFSLKAVYLIRNFKLISEIREPFIEQDLVDKTLTLADVNKQVAAEKQERFDNMIAKRLQHKERIWVQEEQKQIEERIKNGNEKEVQFEGDELVEYDNISSGGISNRSAVSNIHGRKK